MICNIPDADLQQKLHDSLCRYNGYCVYISVREKTICISHLSKNDIEGLKNPTRIISKHDQLFDVSSPSLGYCNLVNNRVVYITRNPIRRVKQGLSLKAISVNTIGRKGQIPVSAQNLWLTQPFFNMIENKYPDLEDSIKKLRGLNSKDNEFGHEVAVTRDIALHINKLGMINVFHKTEHVGWIEPNKFVVNVANDSKGWIISRYLSHGLSWVIN